MARQRLGAPRFFAIVFLGPIVGALTFLAYCMVEATPDFGPEVGAVITLVLIFGFIFGFPCALAAALIYSLVFPHLPRRRLQILAALIIGFACGMLGMWLCIVIIEGTARQSLSLSFLVASGVSGASALALLGVAWKRPQERA